MRMHTPILTGYRMCVRCGGRLHRPGAARSGSGPADHFLHRRQLREDQRDQRQEESGPQDERPRAARAGLFAVQRSVECGGCGAAAAGPSREIPTHIQRSDRVRVQRPVKGRSHLRKCGMHCCVSFVFIYLFEQLFGILFLNHLFKSFENFF